jgi:beta-glucanase (GH16 family)
MVVNGRLSAAPNWKILTCINAIEILAGNNTSMMTVSNSIHRKFVLGLLLAAGTGFVPVCAADWQLVWSDNFDKPGLPQTDKWRYETGFIRNNELQFYTGERSDNARIENGNLVIEGRKERYLNPDYKPGAVSGRRRQVEFADYTAASLNTDGKASFLYGRIEVRAKLPHGKGVWPAIWMMGTNHSIVGWPRCGEIDIMEFVGKEPDGIHATLHFSKEGRHASKGGKITTTAPYNDFHIYAVEWRPDRMDFFFDQQKYFTFDIDLAGVGADNPFRKPHYLLINLALGGSWGGPMDDSVLPQQYLIDYVRIYESKKESSLQK